MDKEENAVNQHQFKKGQNKKKDNLKKWKKFNILGLTSEAFWITR